MLRLVQISTIFKHIENCLMFGKISRAGEQADGQGDASEDGDRRVQEHRCDSDA